MGRKNMSNKELLSESVKLTFVAFMGGMLGVTLSRYVNDPNRTIFDSLGNYSCFRRPLVLQQKRKQMKFLLNSAQILEIMNFLLLQMTVLKNGSSLLRRISNDSPPLLQHPKCNTVICNGKLISVLCNLSVGNLVCEI